MLASCGIEYKDAKKFIDFDIYKFMKTTKQEAIITLTMIIKFTEKIEELIKENSVARRVYCMFATIAVKSAIDSKIVAGRKPKKIKKLPKTVGEYDYTKKSYNKACGITENDVDVYIENMFNYGTASACRFSYLTELMESRLNIDIERRIVATFATQELMMMKTNYRF
jgi:hypothetical protein